MKTPLNLLLLFLIVVLMLMGSGSVKAISFAPPQTASDIRVSHETPRIRTGWTNSLLIRVWGEPSTKDVTGYGEIWVWGAQNWKRPIPSAGPFLKVQTSKVLFGPDGLVKDFRLTDKGDMMSDMEGHSAGFNAWLM